MRYYPPGTINTFHIRPIDALITQNSPILLSGVRR